MAKTYRFQSSKLLKTLDADYIFLSCRSLTNIKGKAGNNRHSHGGGGGAADVVFT